MLVSSYIVLCIFLGGSSQGTWTNLSLQFGGIALLAWAAIGPARNHTRNGALAVNLLLICALLVILIQLIPLPVSIWTKLQGRAELSESLALLRYPIRPAPISEVPYGTVLTLFGAIPAIAAFAATERLAPSQRAIALAIVFGMIASIFLGAIQAAGGPNSRAYFYPIHNPGAVGFFANQNHMATLLLVGTPMAAALVRSMKSDRQSSAIVRYGLGALVFLLIVLGLVLNASRAALGLFLPIVIASAALFPAGVRWRRATLAISAVALVGGVAVVMSTPITSSELAGDQSAPLLRGEIWSATTTALEHNFPLGTGLGSFEQVYHRYEDAGQVTTVYVNHAHNDYLETVLELGAGGFLLILAFLGWWVVMSVKVWTSRSSTPFVRAATIASAAILAHSFVDFPLRTAAISAIFAACIAMIAEHGRASSPASSGERPRAHHVIIG